MSALDHIAAARNDAFASRVLMLSFTTAQNVESEDPATPDHAVRVDYASRVIRGDDNAKMMATQVIASNSTIQATIDSDPSQQGANVPDNDIAFALSSIWTARAIAFQAAPAATKSVAAPAAPQNATVKTTPQNARRSK